MTSARVVGAGLSGLAAAWCLAEAGFDVDVVDAAAGPGGLIKTTKTPHGLVEQAANAFVWNATTERWFAALGITPLFPSPDSRRRFIFRNGRPRRWPLTIVETAALAARAGVAVASRRTRADAHESVAAWSDRVFGRAATSWLVSPALQGIYAAPADRLSAHAVFPPKTVRRTRGSRRVRLAAPTGGMGEFIERLADRLVRRGVRFSFNAPVAALDASIPTIVCTDVRTAATLVMPHASRLGAALSRVSMNATISATAIFEPKDDVHGFGVLFPRGSGVGALGVLFNTDIFTGRGAWRSETWIYGSADPAVELASDAGLRAALIADRRLLTSRSDEPLAVHVSRRSPSLPIYGPAILDVQQALSDLPPWLALAGNYLGRLGVAKLLDVASEAAGRIAGAS